MTRHRRPLLGSLFLTATALLGTQHDPRPHGRPGGRSESPRGEPPRAAPTERRRDSAPQTRSPEIAPPPRPIERHPQPEARAWQDRKGWNRNAWPAQGTWREHRALEWQAQHRSWRQRGGYGGYVIPSATYRNTFGERHVFRLGTCPQIYHGYPRFRHGGYWFLIVDPWPEFWVDDWYAWDDVFIVWDLDGYYLVNPRHPGVRLALMVSL